MLQTVAILLIFIQSRFQFYLWCTRQCTIEHFMKPIHTWSGLIAYILAVIQIIIALYQFKQKFIKRFYFKWFHRILAIVAFIAALNNNLLYDNEFIIFMQKKMCKKRKKKAKLTKLLVALGILSATSHNKTGLSRYYGRWPVVLVGLYLCTFSAALFALSFLDAYSAKKMAEKSEHIGLFSLIEF
ncbi:unnamed protein product [Wuchereria bancrofti]|uniref:Cytochrome b561 domain-containing protein n=1 Tax=Wuchereria bancrofti TaxID=6293 RepID=A0A3P7E6S3_WUCBA|nr:unnamed protein product [Wuchereria bancrofti]